MNTTHFLKKITFKSDEIPNMGWTRDQTGERIYIATKDLKLRYPVIILSFSI